MPHSDSFNTLIGYLMLFFMLSLAPGKLLWGAWTGNESPVMSSKQITQRRRYTWVAAAIAMYGGLVTWLFLEFGLHQTFAGLAWMRQTDAVYGWGLTVMFYFALTIPLWATLALVSIYRHPAVFAYQRRGYGIPTADVRQRVLVPRRISINEYKLGPLRAAGIID